MISEPMSDGRENGPRHVAIIMDGNGRWAKARGLPREVGHERGVEALRRTVEACRHSSLNTLTVFSFSTENWKRPVSEVSSLFALLRLYVRQDLKRLKSEGVRVRVIGSRQGLPEDVSLLLSEAENETAENVSFNLNIAFNYGAQEEITQVCKEIAQACVDGEQVASEITAKDIESRLWFNHSPAPDLLIRTSGEFRISNFMLWQIAYSELVFVDCLWPDFGEAELFKAIEEFRVRDRRFGGLTSKTKTS
jgi:undecaprenyl diphosphate synthase